MSVDLSRFVSAHKTDYDRALSEIKGGKKTSHWIWVGLRFLSIME